MDADEQNEARRDLASRRAIRVKLDAIMSTLLDGLQLEQFAQYPGQESGPHWVAAGVLLVRIMIRLRAHP